MRFARWTKIRSLDIGKAARAAAANVVKDLIQWTDFARSHAITSAVGLRGRRLGRRGGAEQQ